MLTWINRFAGLFIRREDSLQAEVQAHLSMLTDEFRARGMAEEDARAAARKAFGGVDAMKETYRDSRSIPVLEQCMRDIAHAWRAVARRPSFSAPVSIVLGVGLGAAAAVFALVDGVLLKPLNYFEPDRLACIQERVGQLRKQYPSLPVNASHYRAWVERCRGCEQLALLRYYEGNLASSAGVERIGIFRSSASLLDTLGTPLQLGRQITKSEEDTGERVALISDRLWRQRFGGDPAVLGQRLRLDAEDLTVIGVLARSFTLPKAEQVAAFGRTTRPADILVPLGLTARERRTQGEFDYIAFARPKPGISFARMESEINAIQHSLSTPGQFDLEAQVLPLKTEMVRPVRTRLVVLFGAVLAVLALICVNLANLLITLVSVRTREFAIRVALGASTGRVVRQVFLETEVLAMLGGLLAVPIAYAGVSLPARLGKLPLPRAEEVAVTWRIYLFLFALALVVGLAVALIPAWRAGRSAALGAINGGGRFSTTRRRFGISSALVSVETSLTAALLIVAGLFVLSFAQLGTVARGFAVQDRYALDLSIPSKKYTSQGARLGLIDRVVQAVKDVPGIDSAAYCSRIPLEGEVFVAAIGERDDPRPENQRPTANIVVVSPEYFDAVGIERVLGRSLTAADRGKCAVVISEAAKRVVWRNTDPVGRSLLFGSAGPCDVVGVVRDVRATGLDRDALPTVYIPHWLMPADGAIVIKAGNTSGKWFDAVRAALRRAEPELGIDNVRTMRDVIDKSVAERRFQAWSLGAFALTALFLGALGIYSVVAHSVAQRRREIGIRLAFGASPALVRRRVIWQGLAPVGIGLLAGVAVAEALGRAVAGLLFRVAGHETGIAAAVVAVLMAVSVIACAIPAARAAKTAPSETLRSD